MQEIELKFLVPEYKVNALMRQTKIKTSATSQLAAHYFDTPERDLANAGMALRIRKEDADWVQTIKAAGDGMAARLEHNHVLDQETTEQAINEQALAPDLSIYQTGEIAAVFQDFKMKKLAKSLQRQYVTDVERVTRLVKKDGNVIEVAYDLGVVKHGEDETQQSSIHEVEFELMQGNTSYLFEVAKTWCKRYKLCISTVTKAERGGLLLAGKAHSDATKANAHPLEVTDNLTASDFLRAVIHHCMLQILPNASAIAAGSQDGNHVHQLRVGIRRLRTALKFFADFSGSINSDWMPVLKQTFSLLGEYRDRELLQTKTQPMLENKGAPFVDWAPERDSLQVAPIDAVRANDFQVTLLELIEYSMGATDGDNAGETDAASKPAKDQVNKVLSKLFGKISKASSHFADLDIEAQHEVRKRLKSLRYISEFAAPMYKKKHTKKFLKYLEPAQEVLGEYNDDIVGQEFYRLKAESDAAAWFAVGYFKAQQQHAARDCAVSLKSVQDAPVFW
jgi:inorganic triphosphatase YgiF